MKRYRTHVVVFGTRSRSVWQRSFQRVSGIPHTTEVLRHGVRQFKFHRRTDLAPDCR
jgi:hypothetical protein